MELDDIIREYMWLIRFMIRRKIAPSDVDDVSQEVLMAVCLNYRHIQVPSRTGGWIRAIIRNQIASYYRRMERKSFWDPQTASMFMEPFLEHDPVETIASDASTADLVDRLAPRYREVMVLRYLDGLTVKEISEKLDVASVQISNRLSYAKKLLKKHVSRKKISIK